MEFLKELTLASPLPNLKLNEPLLDRLTKGDIGIEIELEGDLYGGVHLSTFKSDLTGAQWTIHRDDSLRQGIEYVLSTPCFDSEVKPLVDFLYSTLEARKSVIRLSNRTSTHIHINVQGLKPSELTSFICLWGLFEQAAVNYSGFLRKSNQFCLTAKDTNGWLPSVWRESLETGRFGWENNVKYSALNLAAFSNFGSFEFRTLDGCNEPNRVTSWAKFLVRLRDTAVKYLPDEIGRGVSEKGPIGLLQEVCGEDLHDFSIAFQKASPTFEEVCRDSFRDYQELAFFVPWESLREQINRRSIRHPFDDDKPKIKVRRPSQETRINIRPGTFQYSRDTTPERPARTPPENPQGEAPVATRVDLATAQRILLADAARQRGEFQRARPATGALLADWDPILDPLTNWGDNIGLRTEIGAAFRTGAQAAVPTMPTVPPRVGEFEDEF